eukprot:GHVU01148218.1.p1 GENE.GHVU01148218.1~~GHVU01148218.1.p1  ORF type:complete len:158 (+),score=5.76 GHVU01148218.1:2694-3167(+)
MVSLYYSSSTLVSSDADRYVVPHDGSFRDPRVNLQRMNVEHTLGIFTHKGVESMDPSTGLEVNIRYLNEHGFNETWSRVEGMYTAHNVTLNDFGDDAPGRKKFQFGMPCMCTTGKDWQRPVMGHPKYAQTVAAGYFAPGNNMYADIFLFVSILVMKS